MTKKILIVLSIGAILMSGCKKKDDPKDQEPEPTPPAPVPAWVKQTTNKTGSLFATFFINETTGFASGNSGLFLKTTDGTSWQPQSNSLLTTGEGLHFIDATTGYMVTNTGQVGGIYKTTDAGGSWTAATFTAPINGLFDVEFRNPQFGLAVGNYGELIRTLDGGVTWVRMTNIPVRRANNIMFTSDSVAYICGVDENAPAGARSKVYKTLTGGRSWKIINLQMSLDNELFDLHFWDDNKGVVVGADGKIIKTTDGGASWAPINSGVLHDLNSVSFVDANTGLAVGEAGTVLKTTDAGTTWTKLSSTVTDGLKDVHFISGKVAYVVGNSGTIIKTTTAGN